MLHDSPLLSTGVPGLDSPAPVEDPLVLDLRSRLDGIEVLRWPDDEPRRRQLAEDAVPRLLVVAELERPPSDLALDEDWIREPVDHEELRSRHAALLQRAGCAAHAPVVDDDGLLWWGDRWVAVPDAQLPIVQLLVARVRQLVRKEDLLRTYEAHGGSPNPVAMKAMLGRLVKRFERVGLDLRAVRGRGYLLDAPNPCPLHALPATEA